NNGWQSASRFFFALSRVTQRSSGECNPPTAYKIRIDPRSSMVNFRMAYEFKATRQVQFSETDMAGLMHFSNFFRFMETAEHGFYRSLGFSVVDLSRHPRFGWPRVHAECDYKKPLRFEDMVEVQVLVAEQRTH